MVQIIFVHPKLKQAKTFNIRRRWLAAFAGCLLVAVLMGSGALSYMAIRHMLQTNVAQIQDWLPGLASRFDDERDRKVRQNIDALAVRLGQMQAQVMRLDALGERVATLTGVKLNELQRAIPGQGGPLVTGSRELSLTDLSAAIEQVSQGLQQRSDLLSLIESELVARTVSTRLLPASQPLSDGFMGSRFGHRIDPFSGRSAMHEGIDFNAPSGTPILAAGAGSVVYAAYHPAYGNQVDIAHGDGIVTRYAHAQRLFVKEGDIVRQGQKIAEVGTTGRSTGAHLHFEVRVNDEAQDPLKYLSNGLNLRNVSLAGAAGPVRQR